jgi:MYXO-CTERM domain-containing protein
MKTLNSFLRIGIFSIFVMLSAESANAQPNDNVRTTTITTDRDNNIARITREHDHDSNWGWLGLLGLLGLAGLLPKKRCDRDHDHCDTNSNNRPINR